MAKAGVPDVMEPGLGGISNTQNFFLLARSPQNCGQPENKALYRECKLRRIRRWPRDYPWGWFPKNHTRSRNRPGWLHVENQRIRRTDDRRTAMVLMPGQELR